MTPQPFYRASDQQPAYGLRYTWCGWSTAGDVGALADDDWLALKTEWKKDHLHLLERAIDGNKIMLTFGTHPVVSPVFLAKHAKGRLEHAFRVSGNCITFSRKVAVRSVGDNITDEVQAYIEAQVRNEQFLDPRFAKFLEQFTVVDSAVDLSLPGESRSGRYWYKLHLVLVTDGRTRIVDETGLSTIRDGSFRIAAKKGYRIAAISAMPDHVHLALRGAIDHTPEEIALSFLNNLAHILRQGPVWRPGYYVGTFGEYNMNAIRRAVCTATPATLRGR